MEFEIGQRSLAEAWARWLVPVPRASVHRSLVRRARITERPVAWLERVNGRRQALAARRAVSRGSWVQADVLAVAIEQQCSADLAGFRGLAGFVLALPFRILKYTEFLTSLYLIFHV
jgi:hypothetical protein